MGKWTDLYDVNSGRWLKVYLELPKPIRTGTATPLGVDAPTLFDSAGTPIPLPKRQMGFRR